MARIPAVFTGGFAGAAKVISAAMVGCYDWSRRPIRAVLPVRKGRNYTIGVLDSVLVFG